MNEYNTVRKSIYVYTRDCCKTFHITNMAKECGLHIRLRYCIFACKHPQTKSLKLFESK